MEALKNSTHGTLQSTAAPAHRCACGIGASCPAKSKNAAFSFLDFSNACVLEKWWHIPVPQESLNKSEIP